MATTDLYDTLDLKQLKCFWAVARYGSLTRAAIELGVSESAIAQRVKALETYLGQKLYETPGGRVRLTGAGEQVFHTAVTLFDQIETFRRELSGSELRGSLKVAAEESALLYLLPKPIQRFIEAYSEVRLEVLARSPSEIVGLVQRGETDLGIISYRPFPEPLVFRAWQEFPGYLITPLGHPLVRGKTLTVQEVLKYPLILPERDTGTYQRVREVLDEEGLGFKVAMEVGTWETVKHYVALGLGIAVISGICLTKGDRSRLEAIEIPDEFSASTTYGILLRRDKHPSPILKAFLGIVDPKFSAEFETHSLGNVSPPPETKRTSRPTKKDATRE